MAEFTLDSSLEAAIAGVQEDEEEVTDAEAQEVMDEIMRKMDGSGGSTGDSGLTLGERKTLLPQTSRALSQAPKFAAAAVAHDRASQGPQALDAYDKALSLFALGLDDAVLGDKPAAQLLVNMESYLERCSVLRSQLPSEENGSRDYSADDGGARQRVLASMAARGFSALQRGVALYRQGKSQKSGESASAGGTDASWPLFVFYSEAVECLLVYVKIPGAKSSPMVTQCISEMLGEIEEIKAKGAVGRSVELELPKAESGP